MLGAPMAARDFFQDAAKKRAAEAVKAVEKQTSAEIVIAVRERSGDYVAVDLTFGAVMALAMFAFLWFSPWSFAPELISVNVMMTFGIASLACRQLDVLRRTLGRRRCRENAELAAKAAFVDLGISKTQGRTGILIYVSMFERACVLVPDVGVDPKAIDGFTKAESALGAAVRSTSFEQFVSAVEALGPVLGPSLPRAEDDVNELPDEVA